VLGELQHFLEDAGEARHGGERKREYTVPAEPAYLKRVDLDRA